MAASLVNDHASLVHAAMCGHREGSRFRDRQRRRTVAPRSRPRRSELALHAKIFGSEAAVRVIAELMKVVGIDSYDHALPLAGWMQDALVLPLFDGGNMGVRRRQLDELLKTPGYDPLAASGGSAEAGAVV